MKVAVNLIAKGRVQGVGFRWFVNQEAQKSGVLGYVRNLPDGNVEIAAEGDEEAVEDFMTQVKKGPGFSRVVDLLIEKKPYSGRFKSFNITF